MSQHANNPSGAPGVQNTMPPYQKMSGMGVASLVLGIVALVTSWLPLVNNFSFFLAALGLVFGVVGIVGIFRGKKRGRGVAVAGIILAVLSCACVLVTQSIYGAAIDQAIEESASLTETDAIASSDNTAASATAPANDSAADTSDEDAKSLSVGDSFTNKAGLSVTVDSVSGGYTDFQGAPLTKVVVSYSNNSDKEVSFNSFDWKAEDAQGAQTNASFEDPDADSLSFGTLAKGGSTSGAVYLEGSPVKILYSDNAYLTGTSAAWSVQ